MFKLKVLYHAGTVVTTSPMNKWDAQAMRRKFDADKDVFSTEMAPVEKDAAQAEFRECAQTWHAAAQRIRHLPERNRDADALAVRNYIGFQRIGTSG